MKESDDHFPINKLNLGNIGDLFGDDQSPPKPPAKVHPAIHAIHRVLLKPDHVIFAEGVLILSGRLGLPYIFNYGGASGHAAHGVHHRTVDGWAAWSGLDPGLRATTRLRRGVVARASRLGGGVIVARSSATDIKLTSIHICYPLQSGPCL